MRSISEFSRIIEISEYNAALSAGLIPPMKFETTRTGHSYMYPNSVVISRQYSRFGDFIEMLIRREVLFKNKMTLTMSRWLRFIPIQFRKFTERVNACSRNNIGDNMVVRFLCEDCINRLIPLNYESADALSQMHTKLRLDIANILEPRLGTMMPELQKCRPKMPARMDLRIVMAGSLPYVLHHVVSYVNDNGYAHDVYLYVDDESNAYVCCGSHRMDCQSMMLSLDQINAFVAINAALRLIPGDTLQYICDMKRAELLLSSDCAFMSANVTGDDNEVSICNRVPCEGLPLSYLRYIDPMYSSYEIQHDIWKLCGVNGEKWGRAEYLDIEGELLSKDTCEHIADCVPMGYEAFADHPVRSDPILSPRGSTGGPTYQYMGYVDFMFVGIDFGGLSPLRSKSPLARSPMARTITRPHIIMDIKNSKYDAVTHNNYIQLLCYCVIAGVPIHEIIIYNPLAGTKHVMKVGGLDLSAFKQWFLSHK